MAGGGPRDWEASGGWWQKSFSASRHLLEAQHSGRPWGSGAKLRRWASGVCVEAFPTESVPRLLRAARGGQTPTAAVFPAADSARDILAAPDPVGLNELAGGNRIQTGRGYSRPGEGSGHRFWLDPHHPAGGRTGGPFRPVSRHHACGLRRPSSP